MLLTVIIADIQEFTLITAGSKMWDLCALQTE